MDTRDRNTIRDMASAIYRKIREGKLGEPEQLVIKEMALGIEEIIDTYRWLDTEWRTEAEAATAAREASKMSRAIWAVYKIERDNWAGIVGNKAERYRVAPVETLAGQFQILNRFCEGSHYAV